MNKKLKIIFSLELVFSTSEYFNFNICNGLNAGFKIGKISQKQSANGIITDPTLDYDDGGPTDLSDEMKKIDRSEFDSYCSAFGITVGSDWWPIVTGGFKHVFKSYSEKNELNYQTDVYATILGNLQNSSYYTVLYRVITSPRQVRNWGVLGIGSHGDNWSFRQLIVNGTFEGANEGYMSHPVDLLNWTPQNNPQSWTETEEMSFSMEPNASISYSISYPNSELQITSQTNVAMYNYRTTFLDTSISDYTKNSACFTGAFTFKSITLGTYVTLDIDATYYGEYYGYTRDNCHSTISIDLDNELII